LYFSSIEASLLRTCLDNPVRKASSGDLHKSTPTIFIDHDGADIWRPFRWKSTLSFVFSGRFVFIDFDIFFASYLGTG